MDLTQALLLGAVQGITEWLPISSEGANSLILTQIYHVPFKDAIVLSLWLHLGTLLAALIYFRKEIVTLIKKRDETWTFLLVSTIVSLIVSAPFVFFGIERVSFNGKSAMIVIGFLLLITGLLQLLMRKRSITEKQPTVRDAIVLGIGQGLAILPGISRSGTTIALLLWRNHSPQNAIRLSFLMSIPAVVIASGWAFLKGGTIVTTTSLLGVATAFVVGLLTIAGLLKVAEKINFGWFCILMGLLSIIAGFV